MLKAESRFHQQWSSLCPRAVQRNALARENPLLAAWRPLLLVTHIMILLQMHRPFKIWWPEKFQAEDGASPSPSSAYCCIGKDLPIWHMWPSTIPATTGAEREAEKEWVILFLLTGWKIGTVWFQFFLWGRQALLAVAKTAVFIISWKEGNVPTRKT